MNSFDVQAIDIHAPFDRAFAYIAEPRTLPEWTGAFKMVHDGRALMQTPGGAVEVSLTVAASREHGTIDWLMGFPDGSLAQAHSRLVKAGQHRCVYSFVLTAPPVPLERLEGALEGQSRILREELKRLKGILESRPAGPSNSR